ncbi:SLATT domain-containing protein [Streptomyces sp. NPDC050504]|uniref:SLATT domain-containing protein n=1 Tax=Streptomyces sp. NPDC050504 TaxID=3365618 RepID=UPI0037B25D6C
MTQPEMQESGEGASGSSGAGGTGGEGAGPGSGAGAGAGAGKGFRASRASGVPGAPWPQDLTGKPFPLGDWGEPAERLDELYRWVEGNALRTAEWYLADRARKRRGARALRLGSALGAVTGAALPLLDLAGAVQGAAGWGYLSLLLGAACMACDRYFGLTSGWMRDLATAQAVQRRLQALQFDWASESVREVLGPTDGTASEAAERCLGVLRRFSEDVTELVRTETADWMVEFRAGPAPLGMQALVTAGGGRGEGPGGGERPGRFPLPPGTRPNMPRQRPPESPR